MAGNWRGTLCAAVALLAADEDVWFVRLLSINHDHAARWRAGRFGLMFGDVAAEFADVFLVRRREEADQAVEGDVVWGAGGVEHEADLLSRGFLIRLILVVVGEEFRVGGCEASGRIERLVAEREGYAPVERRAGEDGGEAQWGFCGEVLRGQIEAGLPWGKNWILGLGLVDVGAPAQQQFLDEPAAGRELLGRRLVQTVAVLDGDEVLCELFLGALIIESLLEESIDLCLLLRQFARELFSLLSDHLLAE